MPMLNWTSLHAVGKSAGGCFCYFSEIDGGGDWRIFHVRQCPCAAFILSAVDE
jgi:hypothetical protein